MLISGTRDERINAIAARQRARVARHQLAAAGIPQSTITRLVRSGRLRRQHSGVFAVGPDAPIPLADETAALLAVRSGAALSHHTAAILWGLRGPDSGDGFIHVTVPGASAAAILTAFVSTAASFSSGAISGSGSTSRSRRRPGPCSIWRHCSTSVSSNARSTTTWSTVSAS